jgi:hypothetical protein
MKTLHAVVAVIIGFAFMTSSGLAAEPKYSGFLGDYYKNLQPGPEGGVKMRWLKPGVTFDTYKKVMVDSVIFYFADDSEYKGIDANEMKELSDSFNQAIVTAFKDKVPMVSEPGPDVARVCIAITHLKQSKPVSSAVSSLVPVGIAFSIVKKGATGSWSGSGATSVEMKVLDSTTNDVIIAAVDERSASYTERFSKWGSAKEAFKFWAERMVTFIEKTRQMK